MYFEHDLSVKIMDNILAKTEEWDRIVDAVQKKLDGETLKEMYSSEDRNKFANDLMIEEFEKEVANRELSTPSEFDIRVETKELLKNVIFIH